MWNSRSLVSKFKTFQSFVCSSTFTIFTITETWLSSTILCKEILLINFVIYRKDRNFPGGGVLAHNTLTSTDSEIPLPPDLEVLAIEVKSTHTFLLCVSYVSHTASSSYCMELIAYLDSICTYNRVVILVDVNCADICWSMLSSTSSFCTALCNLAFKHNLTQLVDFPTHSSGSTLDIIFSSPSVCVTDLNEYAQSCLHSNHSPISFIVPEPTHLNQCSSSLNSTSSTIHYQYKKGGL